MSGRILFFSAWEFGQSGTPGTYKFIEELGRHYRIRVIARPPGAKAVYRDRTLPLLPMGGPPTAERITRMAPVIRQFAPDVLYVFQSPVWPEVLTALKQVAPKARVILDVKSPFLQGDPAKRNQVQKRGDKAAGSLDRIVTLATESAQSWFSHLPVVPQVYPLAVDLEGIAVRAAEAQPGSPRHWVFASSLHPKRQVGVLLQGFSRFLQRNPGAAVLHVFGEGLDRPDLESQAHELGLGEYVCFRGLVPQAELHGSLATFDAGIGWIPRAFYDDSPSLKVLEYAAAGLPVLATATRAQKQMKERGFRFEYCDDDAEGVAGGMERLLEGHAFRGVAGNLEAVRHHAYSHVVREHIVPVVGSLMENRDSLPSGMAKAEVRQAPEREGSAVPHSFQLTRLMFICETLALGKGGAERVVSELACEMAERGHVAYLAYQNRGEPAYAVSSKVVLLPFEETGDLRNSIVGMDIDALIVFYFTRENLVRYAAIADALGTPLVAQECTNPDRLRFRNWRGGGASRARASWEREMVTSVASRLRLVMPGYAASFSAFQQPQIRAIPNCCPRLEARAYPDQSSDGHWRILLVNGFKANKNLVDAVSAFARLAPQHPDWVLRVVGKEPSWDAPHAKKVAEILDEYSLWERFEIAGPTENIATEFCAAHIHLIASLSEGCPGVVLEAMAAGLPSIGFEDCPGTNGLIRHQANGLLAAADDRVAGLAAALVQLMSDPALRAALGSQARRAAADFDSCQTYDRWERLLIDTAGYRDNGDRLFREQYAIDPERALHARRMRKKVLKG